MSSNTSASAHDEFPKDLPPVQAPSGRFIVQLFLVPGLIVTVAVLILLAFGWLVGGESQPDKLLERLESNNAEVRWRAANEIAQRLKRDEELASDPKLALRLAMMLRKAAEELDRITPGTTEAEQEDARKRLLEKRKDLEFLTPCVGNMIVPAGIPILNEIAVQGKGRDPKTKALLRRQAVWALANLGENVKRFASLLSERRDKILGDLHAESLRSGGQSDSARVALQFLQGKQSGTGVITALAECSKADDPFLRTLVALALTFWEGDGDEKALAEKTLQALAYDDGRGARIEIGDAD